MVITFCSVYDLNISVQAEYHRNPKTHDYVLQDKDTPYYNGINVKNFNEFLNGFDSNKVLDSVFGVIDKMVEPDSDLSCRSETEKSMLLNLTMIHAYMREYHSWISESLDEK